MFLLITMIYGQRNRTKIRNPTHFRMLRACLKKTNCAGIVAADILSAVEGGILAPGPTLDFPRFSNCSAGSAGLEAPALRQAGKPAATFFRHGAFLLARQAIATPNHVPFYIPFVISKITNCMPQLLLSVFSRQQQSGDQ